MSILPPNDAIASMALRQQIIANASVLFPKIVSSKTHSLFRRGESSPDVLFEVAVLTVHHENTPAQASLPTPAAAATYQAILTHGLVQKQQTAAVGDHAGTVYGALESLLEVVAGELGVRMGGEGGVEGIGGEKAVRVAGGVVDRGLFEVGKGGKKKGLVGRIGKKKA